jgi:hypothetical protein
MKIQIECTLGEMVEINLALTKRSKSFQSIQLKSNIQSAAIAGISAFVLIYYLSRSLLSSIFGCIIAAVFLVCLEPFLQDSRVEKGIRKMCEEYFENNPNHVCKFELNENGVLINMDNVQIFYDWSKIEEVKETQTTYFFFAQNLSGFSIQKRAFKTEDEKEQFEALLKQYTDKFKQ